MERSYWLEPCEHPECDQPTPLEYCLVEADEMYDDIESIIKVMHEAIDDFDSISTAYGYSEDPEWSLFHRTLSYDNAPSSMLEFDDMGTRDSVYVEIKQRYSPKCTIYTVKTGWQVAGEDYVSQPLKRTYTIEVYPGGPTHCSVEEPDYSPDMAGKPVYIDRQMLPYDFREVHRTLLQLVDLQFAETA